MPRVYRSDVCGKRVGVIHYFKWLLIILRIAKRKLGGGIFGGSKNDFRAERVIPYNPHIIPNWLTHIALGCEGGSGVINGEGMKRETELDKNLATYWECGDYACVFKDTIAPLLPLQKTFHP
jgi:hypothetical protein